ncbi:MAG: hypothetical protein ACLR2R_14435 [Clostridium perfringens]
MNKDEFNNLEIMEQINYLNKHLKAGQSLTNICNSIGIARSTVGGRMTKQGYTLDKNLNQYIINNKENNGRAYSKLTVSDQLAKENPTSYFEHQANKNIETDDINSVVSNKLTSSNPVNTALMLDNTDSDNLTYLLRNIDILKDFIESSKKSSTPKEVNSIEDIISDIYKFKQDKREYKVKSLRIDTDILSEFEAIANDLSSKGINQQEFLNYILKSYVDFFKNIKK